MASEGSLMFRGWRAGWIGWFLNIHSPSAHGLGRGCWCKGTKRELIIGDYVVLPSQIRADTEAYYRFIGSKLNGKGKDVDRGTGSQGIDPGDQGTP